MRNTALFPCVVITTVLHSNDQALSEGCNLVVDYLACVRLLVWSLAFLVMDLGQHVWERPARVMTLESWYQPAYTMLGMMGLYCLWHIELWVRYDWVHLEPGEQVEHLLSHFKVGVIDRIGRWHWDKFVEIIIKGAMGCSAMGYSMRIWLLTECPLTELLINTQMESPLRSGSVVLFDVHFKHWSKPLSFSAVAVYAIGLWPW